MAVALLPPSWQRILKDATDTSESPSRFTCDIFGRSDKLLLFVRHYMGAKHLSGLPPDTVALERVADDFQNFLEHQGLLIEGFAKLIEAFPMRYSEIAAVAEMYTIDVPKRAADPKRELFGGRSSSSEEGVIEPGPPPRYADYVRKKTEGFVGREHVFAELQRFQAGWSCGYMTLTGEPGIGKSAILCELTRRTPCVAHFFIRAEGIARAEQFYREIGEQLRDCYGVDTTARPDDPPGVRLRGWLAAAAASRPGEPILLVIDALDECEDLGSGDSPGNLLYLPRNLPERVYVVLARRELDELVHNFRLETEPDVANLSYDLMRHHAENERDVQAYLVGYFATRPGHPWLARHQLSVGEAVAKLTSLSECNFMYLRHILPHLQQHPDRFEPKELPRGLKEYYVGHWRRMATHWQDRQVAEAMFLTIYLLAAAGKPMTAAQLGQNLPPGQRDLVSTFLAQWREFLEEADGVDSTYRLYHASFADFLAEQDRVANAGRGPTASRSLKGWFLGRLRANRGDRA